VDGVVVVVVVGVVDDGAVVVVVVEPAGADGVVEEDPEPEEAGGGDEGEAGLAAVLPDAVLPGADVDDELVEVLDEDGEVDVELVDDEDGLVVVGEPASSPLLFS
jgi:hypothetical protein